MKLGVQGLSSIKDLEVLSAEFQKSNLDQQLKDQFLEMKKLADNIQIFGKVCLDEANKAQQKQK